MLPPGIGGTPSTITRMIDMGIEPFNVSSAVNLIVAQRLVRRICRACAVKVRDEASNDAREAQLAALYGVRQVAHARGCEACGMTGYRGRLPILEVAVLTPEISEMIRQGVGARQLGEAARAAGMRPMREVAADLVRNGLTTLEEIDRVLGESAQATTPESAGGPATEAPAEPDKAPTVLLVDDDGIVRALARTLLERQGYRVLEAADGMGHTRRQRLWRVELPLAVPLIVAGLRLATVSTIGLVTITGTISDAFGGLGYFILDGYNRGGFPTEMYAGALPSILLALGADFLFVRAQRRITPWAQARALEATSS